MSDKTINKETEENNNENNSPELTTRRDFLRSLGKWSAVIIGTVTATSLVAPKASGWINGGGGAWVNGRGGGGGGSWVNRNNGGGAWINGGGGGWVNGRGGGGSWVNRR